MLELEHGTIYFNQKPIRFLVKRSSRRRTVGISIEPHWVQVTAPKRMPIDRVIALVDTKARWIAKHTERMQQIEPPKRFVDGEVHLYLGRELRLEVVSPSRGLQPELFSFDFSRKPNSSVELKGDTLRVQVAEGAKVREVLEDWYKAQACSIIPSRVEHYCDQLGWLGPTVLVRNQKKRWGSCNAKGELRFNWRLVLVSLELLDYVVVHEMAHLKVLNHSPRFWRLVEQIMPDYKNRHRALNQMGTVLHW